MPRKIIGAAFVSLDGVMQAPGAPEEDKSGGFAYGGWLQPVGDEALGNQIDTVFGSEFDLLLGRRTYEIFAGYWPFQSMDNPIADKFAKADKYLITRAGTSLDWDTTHRLADLGALAVAKQGEGPNLVIQGSSTLYPQLIARGLLDRLILMIAPITLGAGKRLFGEGTPAKSFRLVEQRTGAGGIVALTYDLAGSVETGTFATEPPTDLELARRARVAAGTW